MASELDRLEAQKKLVNLQAEIAEAQKKIREAQPGASVEALQGNTTIDDKLSFEAEAAAYEQLEAAAAVIAADVKTARTTGTVVLMDESIATSFRNLRFFEAHCKLLTDELEAIELASKNISDASTFAEVAGGLRSAIDLISLFRVDTDFKGRTFAVKERALIAIIAQALRKQDLKVVCPRLLPPEVLLPADQGQKPFSDIASLQGARVRLAEVIQKAENTKAELTAELGTLVPPVPAVPVPPAAGSAPAPPDPKLAATIAGVTAKLARCETLRSRAAAQSKLIEEYLALLTKSDAAGASPLTSLISAAAVQRLLTDANSIADSKPSLLDVEVSVAGGSYRTRKSLWLFLGRGAELSFSAGVVVSYSLFDSSSNIVKSGVVTEQADFKIIPNKAAQ